jgi:hypothetical protein
MSRSTQFAAIALALAVTATLPGTLSGQTFPLDSANGLEPHGVTMEPATYKGRKSLHAVAASDAGGVVVVSGTSFHDGVIELELSGKPGAGAATDARGFVGLAFRSSADGSKYECVYIRPTNGRADDQLRRNHSAQYISIPEYEWFRLRNETPGKYESYADMLPDEWIKLRIEVSGVKMRLFVNDAAQPTLIVNDLKHGDSTGAIALWIGSGTDAYFANLRITK